MSSVEQSVKKLFELMLEIESESTKLKLVPGIEHTDTIYHLVGAINSIDEARDELKSILKGGE